MKKEKIIKLLILIILFVVVVYVRFWVVDDGIIVGNIKFNDVAFIKNGKVYTMNSDGNKQRFVPLVYPTQAYFLGQQMSYKRLDASNIRKVNWSDDGKLLGFQYSDLHFPQISYPGVINENGDMFICDDTVLASTSEDFEIQLIDNKILINTDMYNFTRIIQLELPDCDSSDYYRADKISHFLLSSKLWLAVFERIDDAFILNVYDENRKKVFSEDRDDIFINLAWSKDGNMLIYGAEERTTDRDLDDCKMLVYDFINNRVLEFPTGFFFRATFSPDGKEIMFTNSKGINIYNIETNEITFVTQGTNPDWRP